jgi:hypothetical protein
MGRALQAALKRHRQQGGTCALCGASVTRAAAARHLTACVTSGDRADRPAQRLATLRVTAPGLPAYWIDIEVPWEARLDAVDRLLRDLWLECCGHLSKFSIGSTDYFSAGYELDRFSGGLGFGRRRTERRMSAKLRDALLDIGERFTYDYDFGSTTRLQLTVTGERTGNPGRAAVRLLARNTPPVWPCVVCSQAADYMCLRCRYEEDNPFVCKMHMAEHACGEDEGMLPVVNSPRMGVCGYTG